MLHNAKLAVVGLLLPALPLLLLTTVIGIVAVVSLLPNAALRDHVRLLLPLLNTAIRAVRTRTSSRSPSGSRSP